MALPGQQSFGGVGLPERVGPDGFQHQEARLAVLAGPGVEQTQVGQGQQGVQGVYSQLIGGGHSLGGVLARPARRHGQSAQHRPVCAAQQFVAGPDGGVERVVAGRAVGGRALRQGEASVQPGHQRVRAKLYCTGGSQFDGERQPIESGAQAGHRRQIGQLRSTHRPGAFQIELHRR